MIGTSPLKCTKSGMADEAEEFMWINGSEGLTARCVTHLGHSLDGSRSVASHHGRDWTPTMYLPKLVMDRHSIRFRSIDGEVETHATEPDKNYWEEDNVSLASKLVDDEDVLNPRRRTPSDSSELTIPLCSSTTTLSSDKLHFCACHLGGIAWQADRTTQCHYVPQNSPMYSSLRTKVSQFLYINHLLIDEIASYLVSLALIAFIY